MSTQWRATAVIGAGKMGEALIAGIVRSGIRSPGELWAADSEASRLSRMTAEYGVRAAANNAEAVAQAQVVLLAVKPKDLGGLLAELGPALRDRLIVSVAAGVTTRFIEEAAGSAPAVVRAMPNVAAQVGEGVTAVCPGSRASAEHVEVAAALLASVGPVVETVETLLDAVTAVSGSGPAYFALVAEALIDAGVAVGLPREIASRLVAQTIKGTAALLTDGGMDPAAVRQAVTSPAGTTAMGLAELERAGVRAAAMNAVKAARDRSAELAQG